MFAMPFVLFLFMSTSSYSDSGAASVTYKFDSHAACMNAGNILSKSAHERSRHVLTWACVPVSLPK